MDTNTIDSVSVYYSFWCDTPRVQDGHVSLPADVVAYLAAQPEPARSIGDRLAARLSAGLAEAEAKVWHGHPVWFLEGNPVAGFATRTQGVHLLFWSGQSFTVAGLEPEGSFKAAGFRVHTVGDIDAALVDAWISEARTIQWDYKNIRARRGVLEPLTPETR